MLQFLLDISGLELNKEKSMTYWSQKQSYKKSAWIEKFKWRWALNGELSKMFSIPFRIGLDRKEVDTFFYGKDPYKVKILEHNPLIDSGLGHSCQFCFGINLMVIHQHIGGYKEIDKEV